MFPSCQQCSNTTRPATAKEASIFGAISAMPGLMTWHCPNCGGGFVRPLESHQIKEIQDYFKKDSKKWWQFWK